MPDRADPRIPVTFGALRDLGPGDAALLEGAAAAPDAVASARFELADPGHAPGCACCRPRTGAAEALALLFLARARGRQGWFQRVVALETSEAGRQAVSQAVREDVFAVARFRLEGSAVPAPRYRRGPEGAA